MTAPHSKPYETELVLRHDETRRLVISLEPEASNHVWWWIAGGVVVAGAAVGGYFLLRPQSEPEGPSGSLGFIPLTLTGARQ